MGADACLFKAAAALISDRRAAGAGYEDAQQKIQINRIQSLGQDARVVKGIRGLVDFFYAIDQGAVANPGRAPARRGE